MGTIITVMNLVTNQSRRGVTSLPNEPNMSYNCFSGSKNPEHNVFLMTIAARTFSLRSIGAKF